MEGRDSNSTNLKSARQREKISQSVCVSMCVCVCVCVGGGGAHKSAEISNTIIFPFFPPKSYCTLKISYLT